MPKPNSKAVHNRMKWILLLGEECLVALIKGGPPVRLLYLYKIMQGITIYIRPKSTVICFHFYVYQHKILFEKKKSKTPACERLQLWNNRIAQDLKSSTEPCPLDSRNRHVTAPPNPCGSFTRASRKILTCIHDTCTCNSFWDLWQLLPWKIKPFSFSFSF